MERRMPREHRDDLPEGWSLEPLAECVDVLDSRRKPVNSKERASRKGPIPYYGATGQVGWIDDYLFDEELVLLGEDGAPFFDKSKPIAYIVDGKSWVNNHAHVLRARADVTSNRFMKYYLDSFDFDGYVQGSTRDKLTQGAMNAIPVVLPPRELQDELVTLIEAVALKRTSALGHLSAGRRAVEGFRQAVLAAACTGRLTTDWRAKHPDAMSVEHALVEQRARAKRVSKEQSVDLEIPKLPDSYLVGTIGDAATRLDYGTSKRVTGRPGQGIPVVGMSNIQDGRLDLSDLKSIQLDREIERLLLVDGDLLFNRTNSPELVGKSAVYRGSEPISFASYLIRVRVHPAIAEPDFIQYWIGSAWGRLWARLAKTDGVSQSNINGSKLALMSVPLPPIEEQRLIVERARKLLGTADRLVQQLDDATRKVERSSQALLAQAFRGELTASGSASEGAQGLSAKVVLTV
jgi:type I restriction enzyme S subunit